MSGMTCMTTAMTRRLLPFASAFAAALFLFSAFAFAADDPLQTARGISLNNALKRVCASQYKVNAKEIDKITRMIVSLVPKQDAAAVEQAVATQDAALAREIEAKGAGDWCLDRKAKLLAVGGARMFQ